jgi:hypothetical protein
MTATEKPELRITFSNARGVTAQLGPFQKLLFERQQLKDENGSIVATHVAHQWQLPDGSSYLRLECYFPCDIRFERPIGEDGVSRQVGPFSTLSSVNGVLYADHSLLAFCDSQMDDWYSFEFHQHYGCVIVEPIAPRSR